MTLHRVRSHVFKLGKKKIGRKRTVPKTETGGMVENTKAYERTILKELGKMTL